MLYGFILALVIAMANFMQNLNTPITLEPPAAFSFLTQSWESYKPNWPVCALTTLVIMGIPAIGGLCNVFLTGLIGAIFKLLGGSILGGVLALLSSTIVFILIGLASMVASLYFGTGWTIMNLKVAAGQEPELTDLKPEKEQFIRFSIVCLLATLGITAGMFLFVIPGIYLLLRWSFAPYLVLDADLTPKEALKQSWSLSAGYEKQLLLFWLAVIPGLIILCMTGIGGLAALPFAQIFLAQIYYGIVQYRSAPEITIAQEESNGPSAL